MGWLLLYAARLLANRASEYRRNKAAVAGRTVHTRKPDYTAV